MCIDAREIKTLLPIMRRRRFLCSRPRGHCSEERNEQRHRQAVGRLLREQVPCRRGLPAEDDTEAMCLLSLLRDQFGSCTRSQRARGLEEPTCFVKSWLHCVSGGNLPSNVPMCLCIGSLTGCVVHPHTAAALCRRDRIAGPRHSRS
jgi:hypothetical protein